LEDGIVVAEKDERDLRGLANAANEIKDADKRGAGFERALGSSLDRRAIGKRVAEWNAELDDVGAGFRERQNKVQRGFECRVTGRDVRDNAKFARGAQFGEAIGNAGRVGRHS